MTSALEQARGHLTAALNELKMSMDRMMALKQMTENTINTAGEASRKLETARNQAYNAIGPAAGNISGMMVVLDDKASQYVQGSQAQLQRIQEYLTTANQLKQDLEKAVARINAIMRGGFR